MVAFFTDTMICGFSLYQILAYFLVYSCIGWCLEVVYAAVSTGQLVNRGFLNGPVCPIYGFGMIIVLFLLTPLQHSLLLLYIGGVILPSTLELAGGWALYKLYHTRWWDYSMYRFNLGGFICPQFSLLWGLGSVLLMVVVPPLLCKPSAAIPTLVLIWLDVIFGGLFLADLIVSAIQAVGFSKQLARIDELRKAMRTTSDALTEVIGTSAMTMDTLLDEQKLQLT